MEKQYELAKWLAGEMSESELSNFKKTPKYTTYLKIANYSKELKAPHIQEDNLYKNIIENKKSTKKVIPLFRNWFLKVAAAFVIGLGITFVIQNFTSQSQTALNGKRTTFTLPDKSEVVLNSGSEIEYKKWNWSNNRKLQLKGEAYFQVAKGKQFEVETPLGKVTVLGTHFDVKARTNRFDVTCFEGKVKVNYKEKQILLTHGQSVTFENNIQIVSKTDASKPEWLENKIAFKREKLQQIVEEIERQYNISIELQKKDSDELFTGKIPTDNLDIALEIIATTYHFKINKVNSNKIIFEEK